MARAKQKAEPDSVYFLKILLFFIIGALWLQFSFEVLPGLRGIPIGLVIGLLFARHEHFMIDRKIEYLVLLAAALLSYLAPIGIVIEI